MSEERQVAFVTGAASGIGRAVVQMLIGKGLNVFLADCDFDGATSFASDLNSKGLGTAVAAQVDVADWKQQATVFKQAVSTFGKIDYVYPIAGIGERRWLPENNGSDGFEEPDLSVIDINTKGVLYTCSIAIQHFRKQVVSKDGFRGKIFCVASMCGFYAVPTLPIYTAAKFAVVGFVRSYGKYLLDEKITMNAICPNVVRTNISSGAFYSELEQKGLLTPMKGLLDVFDSLLGASETSGEIFEVGPNGVQSRSGAEYMDDDTKVSCELLLERGRRLQMSSK